MKKSTVKLTTIFALLINVFGFVLTMIFGTDGFGIEYYIVWGLSLIWLALVISVNCFYKDLKNKSNNIRYARY